MMSVFSIHSWGLFWGERGFMRILRGSNKVAGICGINVEPAQGSGGYIVATGDGQSTDPQSQLEESLSRRFYRWLDDFELWFMVNWQVRNSSEIVPENCNGLHLRL